MWAEMANLQAVIQQMRSEGARTPAVFKSWVFGLITAVGSVDQSLAGALRGLLQARTKIEIDENCFKIDEDIVSGEIIQSIQVNCTP